MYSLDWPYALGTPNSTAVFKLSPEDFQVNEFFADPFSGQGEHIVLKIEKRGLTTEEVVKSLSKIINKPTKLISYAGLKDRQALTTQWFSIHAPGEEIAGIETLETPNWRVLDSTRHHKKIRPGFLTGNQFVIRLRDVSHPEEVASRLETIQSQGVPNYFGEQRFGRNAGNLFQAHELLTQNLKVKDRFLKGIYYSAARSWLFNLIVGLRVTDLTWNTPLANDVMQLSGSNSIFKIESVDDNLVKRIKEKDLSPASPLPGKSKSKENRIAPIEKIYSQWEPWIRGLEQQGLEEAWRPNILHLQQLECSIKDKSLQLSFTLPPGSYATSVLRELVLY